MRTAALAHGVLGLTAFLSVSGLVRALQPGPELVASTPKLEYFRDHASEFDAVFLGSSRVYRHFVPEVIDGRLAELGRPLRSFNFGVPGAGAFEIDHLLRRILAIDGVRLSYVFLEPTTWSPSIFAENRETERTIAWHTPTGTRHALEASWRHSASPVEFAESAALHLRLFGWWLSNLGQGPRLYRALAGHPPLQPLTVEEAGRDQGYRPLEIEKGEGYPRRRKKLLEDPEGFEEKVARLPVGGKLGRGDVGADTRLIEEQARLVRQAGAEPVYVIPPGTVATPVAYQRRRQGLLGVLFAFNDPRKFPAYYQFESFFDRNHLDEEAARTFSLAFAEAFAAWLQGESTPALVRTQR